MIQIVDLIGTPYNQDTFNCWHLVCEVYSRLSQTLPDFTPPDGNFNKAFLRELGRDVGFDKVTAPSDYDIVILRNPHYIHCGVVIGNRVLHNDGRGTTGQVTLSYMSDIRDSFKQIEYYTWRELN